MSRLRRLASEGAWVIVGQILSVVAALVQVRVLTEYLSPSQYGELALGLTAAGFVNQVVMGGIIAGVGRFYAIAAEKRDLGGYLNATRFLLVNASVAVMGIGLALALCLYWLGYSQWIGLAAAALMLSVAGGYNSTLNAIQNAERRRAMVAFHGGLDAWLKIPLAVCALLWLGPSSTAVVIGYVCATLLTTLSQLLILCRSAPQPHTPIQCHQEWAAQIWTYALPFTVFGAFTWVQQISDRWALQAFAKGSDVGQYAVLFQLGFTPIALITGMAVSLLGPILYQRSGDATDLVRNLNVHRLGWRMTHIALMVTLLSFAAAFAVHAWLFNVLVASEYQPASYLLPWVVLAGGLFAAGQMLALKLMSEMKPSAMTVAKIVTAVIGAMLNIVGAAIAGMQGVVAAMVTFSCMYFVWMALLAKR